MHIPIRFPRATALVTTLAAALLLCAPGARAAAPDAALMQGYGTDMGRAQRCGVAVAEILLFAQLAKDLTQKSSQADALNSTFYAAATAARNAPPPECAAATARFDEATAELYKRNGR